MNPFEIKIDQLFEQKRAEALRFKKSYDEPIAETKEELKHIPFNVSVVLRQIEEETERRAKTLKRGNRTGYKDDESG